MNDQLIRDYLDKMKRGALFTAQSPDDQTKALFDAKALLTDHYAEKKLTVRAVALQTLFMLEGEDEEYSKLKRHDISNASAKGVSVTFDGTEDIAPDVRKILGPPRSSTKGRVGSLI